MIPPLFRSSPYLLFSDSSSSRECAAAGLTHQRRRRCIGAIVGRHSLERSVQPAQHVRQSRCRGVLALLGGLLVRGVEEGGVASSAGVRAQSFRVPCGSDGLSFLRPVCVRCCSRGGSRLLRRCGHTCCLLAFGNGRLFRSGRRALSFGTFSECVRCALPQHALCCLCMHCFFGRRRSERQKYWVVEARLSSSCDSCDHVFNYNSTTNRS